MTDISVKICGVTRPSHIEAAAEAGARYIGLVFFPKSPRYLTPEAAAPLAIETPVGLAKVALLVDPDNALLDEVAGQVPLDMIQLHGDEAPERVVEVRQRTGLPVMKALGLSDAGDLAQIDRYSAVADQLLIDAKPPQEATLPGGNGLSFDWRLLAGRRWSKPWMLAGGLDVDTVDEAVRLTGARQVDVSTGVEKQRGVKDLDLVRAFVTAARSAASL